MSSIITDPQKIDEILSRGVAEVIDLENLRKKLLSGEQLRIKLGIDPTSPNIHIGRGVVLHKLAEFQRLGHQIVFIVGDFTGEIGDTSDKESERPMLTKETIQENLKSYVEQAGKILNLENAEIRHNSEWLEKLNFGQIGKLADAFSLAEFSARENIKKRLDAGKRVSLREMLYPLMQGYDSVAIEADVELGGTDQRFNLLAGRELQKTHSQDPQDVLMMNLILGTDGRKMSSSWGNTINLTDEPNDMFGKVMSIPDELIITYLEHCTRVTMEEIQSWKAKLEAGENPRDAKVFLAQSLVALYHGEKAAEEAVEYFVNTFSKGELPENVEELAVEAGALLVDVLANNGLATSKSDARRKIEQGGVSIDGEKTTDVDAAFSSDHGGKILKVGKKDFRKIVL
jgi:tyrosyl-tRNA synthetase